MILLRVDDVLMTGSAQEMDIFVARLDVSRKRRDYILAGSGGVGLLRITISQS